MHQSLEPTTPRPVNVAPAGQVCPSRRWHHDASLHIHSGSQVTRSCTRITLPVSSSTAGLRCLITCIFPSLIFLFAAGEGSRRGRSSTSCSPLLETQKMLTCPRLQGHPPGCVGGSPEHSETSNFASLLNEEPFPNTAESSRLKTVKTRLVRTLRTAIWSTYLSAKHELLCVPAILANTSSPVILPFKLLLISFAQAAVTAAVSFPTQIENPCSAATPFWVRALSDCTH
jgi:hypothetical protein